MFSPSRSTPPPITPSLVSRLARESPVHRIILHRARPLRPHDTAPRPREGDEVDVACAGQTVSRDRQCYRHALFPQTVTHFPHARASFPSLLELLLRANRGGIDIIMYFPRQDWTGCRVPSIRLLQALCCSNSSHARCCRHYSLRLPIAGVHRPIWSPPPPPGKAIGLGKIPYGGERGERRRAGRLNLE